MAAADNTFSGEQLPTPDDDHTVDDGSGRTDLLRRSGGGSRERADAARNRQRVLAAAEQLFASNSPASVTMGDIARAAGVGRATLYRRYPNPASVAVALLDEHERRLQQQLISGARPLGPGAPPADRLAACYAAMVELLDQHLQLRARTPPNGTFWLLRGPAGPPSGTYWQSGRQGGNLSVVGTTTGWSWPPRTPHEHREQLQHSGLAGPSIHAERGGRLCCCVP